MGIGPFWVGFAGAMKEDRIRTEDTEKEDRRIGEQRAWQEGQTEKDRAFSREMAMTKINADRQNTMAEYTMKALSSGGGSSSGSAPAGGAQAQQWGLGQLELLDPETRESTINIASAVASDPRAALQLQKMYEDSAKDYSENNKGVLTFPTFIETLQAVGTDATPAEVASFATIYATDYTDGATFMEDMSKIKPGSPAAWSFISDQSLKGKAAEDLYKKQVDFFKEAVGIKASEILTGFGDDGDRSGPEWGEDDSGQPTWNGMSQATYGDRLDERGDEYLWEFVGTDLARDFLDGSGTGPDSSWRQVGNNPLLGKYFKSAFDVDQTPTMPDAGQTPEAFSLGATNDPVFRPDRNTSTAAYVLPLEVNVNGMSVKTDQVGELNKEMIDAHATPVEDWKTMSPEEREKVGQNVSEAGGVLFFATEDSPEVRYEAFKSGQDYIEAENARNPEIETPVFDDDRNTTAADKIRKALKTGYINYGDWVIINGVEDQIIPKK